VDVGLRNAHLPGESAFGEVAVANPELNRRDEPLMQSEEGHRRNLS